MCLCPAADGGVMGPIMSDAIISPGHDATGVAFWSCFMMSLPDAHSGYVIV